MQHDYKEEIDRYIESQRDNMISDLRELVKIPSVAGKAEKNMPFGKEPARALEKALELCKREGLDTVNVNNYVGTADFYPECDADLGILCHVDVVPAGDGWSFPPFDITEHDGRLYGRGAIDDKGPAIAALYAIKAVRELKIPLSKNVRLIIGTNEENGSSDLDYYCSCEKLPDMLFTPDGSYPVINIEKGMIRAELKCALENADNSLFKLISLDGGTVVNAVPSTARAVVIGAGADDVKRAAEGFEAACVTAVEKNGRTEITVCGKSAHASTPETGVNALTALLGIIELLDKAGTYKSISSLVRLFPFGETDGAGCSIKCSDEISGALTCVLSLGGLKNGILCFKLDIRFPVSKSSHAVSALLEQRISSLGGIDFETLLAFEPHHVPSECVFVKSLLRVYEDVTGKKGRPLALGGLTYVHGTTGGVAFGAEFPGEENNMHNADESISVESLLLNAKIYANAITALCSEGE